MNKTVLGIFEPTTNTEHLINDLQAEGFNLKDISTVMRDNGEIAMMGNETGGVLSDTVGGLATGIIIGTIAGLLGAITIPGIETLLIGGSIATALGLTGLAATAASGAVTGAIAGGLIGALMGLGLPREEAERYQKRIKEGAIIVAVPTNQNEAIEVESLFHDYHAIEIRTVSHEKRRYRTQPGPHYGFASKGGRSMRKRTT
jgi:hypothetical protein